MNPTATDPARTLRVGDESLPMMTREFQILNIKRAKKIELTEAEKSARAALLEERKKAKAAAKAADPDEPDDDPEDDEEDEMEGERADSVRFDISISSEYPVQRWFGTEILDHSAGAVDLSRAKLGMSYLVEHDSRNLVGIIDGVRVGKDKVLRGQVQFSRSAQAQGVKQDILDGIRRFISVGYQVNEYVLQSSSDTEGDTYRATKWTPMEASSVAVPADPTVGQNRAEGTKVFPVVVRSSIQAASKPNKTEVTVVESQEQINAARNTASAEIIRLGKRHGMDIEETAGMIGEGLSIEQASVRILESVAKRGTKVITQPGSEEVEDNSKRDMLTLSDREQARYNIARGIMATIVNKERSDGGSAKRENCLELEISDTIAKSWRGAPHGGLFIPWNIRHHMSPELLKRAGLDSKTSGTGLELKFTEPGEFIDFLYNTMRVKELGAKTVSGLRDNVAFPRQTGRATGSWVAENPGSDVSDSNLTLGQIASSPKTYQSSTSYSRQLLAQAVIDVDTLVREDLARDLALAVDTAAISGTGSSNMPTGILHTSGVQAYTLEADTGNGGALAWDDIVKISELLEDANADQLGNGGWLTTPGVKSSLKRTARLGNTIGLPIWADDDTVDGYEARSSNQVPKAGTEGSGSNLHTIIRGVFETMVIAMWGSGFELVVDPYRLKKQGMIELTTFMLADIVLKYPQAFVVNQNVITT